MKVYAFDVDDTLEISGGPVTIQSIVELRNAGHVVGLCGNWGVVFARITNWYVLFQFFNYGQVKNVFLHEVKAMYIPGAEDYIFVGNVGPLDAKTFGVPSSGGSNDMSQARGAGWRFLSEREFADGAR